MSFAPDEDAATLFAERAWLQGALLTGVGYGMNVILAFMCLRALWLRRSDKRKRYFFAYVSFMWLFGTIFFISCCIFTDQAFVDDRNFPGGPNSYEEDMFSVPADEIGNVAFVLANWLADGLMVWRLFTLYKGCSVSAWVPTAFPLLMFAGSFVMGILFLIQLSLPASSPFVTSGINWTLPYLTLSLSLNVIVTIMIVCRLIYYRWSMSKALGTGHTSQYTSIAAMLVESAAIYTAFGLLFLVPFVLNNALANIFLQTLGEAQIIATLLIIYRVAEGKGWSGDTATKAISGTSTSRNIPMSSITFKQGPSETHLSSNFTAVESRVDMKRTLDTDLEKL